MKSNDSQRGAVSFKLLVTLLLIFSIGHALFNYLPAIYNAENLRSEIHTAVLQGMSLPPTMGNPVDLTKKRLLNAVKVNNAPANAAIDVRYVNNIMQARVSYTQSIPILPFGLYDYPYQFNYTTNNGNYLSKEY